MATASRIQAGLLSGCSSEPEDYATFLRQFNNAVRAIAPVTLIDLGSPWRPFPGTVEYKWFNRFLVLLGVFMIIMIAFYTQLYTAARDTLVTIHAVQQAAIDDKLDTLKTFLAEHPALRQSAGDPLDPSKNANAPQQDIQAARAVLSNYLKDLRVVNELASEMQTAVFYISQDDELYPPFVLPVYREFSHLYASVMKSAFSQDAPPTPPSGDPNTSPPRLSQEEYLANLAAAAHPNPKSNPVTLGDNSDTALEPDR